MVVGYDNTVLGPHAAVTGGIQNRATEVYTVVSGGYENQATYSTAIVSGGRGNIANEFGAAVFPVEELEKNLRADVVREVASDHKRAEHLQIA